MSDTPNFSLAPIVAETEREPEPAPVGKPESEPESAPADKPESEPESEPPARRGRCRPPLMALASRASERRWQEEMEAALHEPPPVPRASPSPQQASARPQPSRPRIVDFTAVVREAELASAWPQPSPPRIVDFAAVVRYGPRG
jgi:hypothetical protein